MFDAIIFDFDGVILDSEPLHYEACCAIFKEIGVSFTYAEYEEKYIGLADKQMFPDILRDNSLVLLPQEIETLIENKIQYYTEIIKAHDNLPIVPGVTQFIKTLTKENKKIAICSAATRSEIIAALEKINKGELEPFFNIITTADDVRFAKPSPEGYILTAARLGIAPNRCLVFEDTPHGISAAKQAGMSVIGLLTTHHAHELKLADAIITNFTQLPIPVQLGS